MQLVSFFALVLTTIAFAQAVSDDRGALLLWKALVALGLVHSLAFLYQYMAAWYELPLIGISRAHGMTVETGAVGDLAAFELDGDFTVLRPGGLAGEPKTVAIIFGLVVLSNIATPIRSVTARWWRILARASMALSLVAFVGAFSTSGFLGFAAAYLLLMLTGLIPFPRAVMSLLLLAIALLFAIYLSSALGLPDFGELLKSRTLERLSGDTQLDSAVDAALVLLARDPLVLVFGTGIGGGSFRLMEVIGQTVEYALTPNIGLIALLLELGIVGTFLLVVPFLALILLVVRNVRLHSDSPNWWAGAFLASLSLSAMCLMLTGSGIALGFPLAVGSALGAMQYLTRPIDHRKPSA